MGGTLRFRRYQTTSARALGYALVVVLGMPAALRAVVPDARNCVVALASLTGASQVDLLRHSLRLVIDNIPVSNDMAETVAARSGALKNLLDQIPGFGFTRYRLQDGSVVFEGPAVVHSNGMVQPGPALVISIANGHIYRTSRNPYQAPTEITREQAIARDRELRPQWNPFDGLSGRPTDLDLAPPPAYRRP